MSELTKKQLEEALENCATEPVHMPGAIQPHGYFLAFTNNFEQLTHCSTNIEALLGVSAEHLLGHAAPDYLKTSWQQHLLRLRQISSDSVGFNDEINSTRCIALFMCLENISALKLNRLPAH